MPKWMVLFMTNDIFIDTSGFYTILIQSDNSQEEADCSELHFFNFSTLLAHHSYVFRIILR